MLREAALAAAGVVVLTIAPALAGPMTVLSGEVHDAASGTPLPGANLTYAGLKGANLLRANLRDAGLSGANLDDVILADFCGALNVPERYLKD